MHNLCITKVAYPPVGDYTNSQYMEDIYTTKLIRVGNSLSVVIPRNILKANNWKKGDHIIFTFAGLECVILKRLTDADIRKIKDVEQIIQA